VHDNAQVNSLSTSTVFFDFVFTATRAEKVASYKKVDLNGNSMLIVCLVTHRYEALAIYQNVVTLKLSNTVFMVELLVRSILFEDALERKRSLN